jgi:prepilin-type N-terminal cleavage/methylation domain-containing protein
MFKKKKAFTLIELLVVIAIIGILATVSIIALSNARAKSRDAKRAGDIKQVQTALELFFNDQGRYPTAAEFESGVIYSTSSNSTSTYMQVIPTAPTPADGNCGYDNSYVYESLNDNTYTLGYCLGGQIGTLAAGNKCANPGGVSDSYCGNPCKNAACQWQYVGSYVSDGTASSTSIAIYNGTPYVAYADSYSGGKASVKKFNGSTWVAVGNLGFSDGMLYDYSTIGVSLSIGDDGVPYVFYSDSSRSNRGVVKKFDGSSWVDVGTNPMTTGIPYSSKIKVYQGTPYVSYSDNAVGLVVKKFDGSDWVSVGPSPVTTDTAYYSSFDFYDDDIYLVYYEWTPPNNKVKVIKFDGTSWGLLEDTNVFASTYSQISIAVKNGVPYVIYNINPYVIKYEAGAWTQVGSQLSPGNSNYLNIFANSSDVYVSFQAYWGWGYQAAIMKYTGVGALGWDLVGSTFGWPPPFVGNYPSEAQADFISSVISNNVIYISYIDINSGRIEVRRFYP